MAKLYCYYRPAGSSGASSSPSAGGYLMDFGHFMIEVEKGNTRTTFDYWLGDRGSVVQTTIDESRRRDHLYISFYISDSDADRMVAKIKSWARKPPGYEFPSGSTCVSRSNEILSIVGLNVNDVLTPTGIWDALLRKRLIRENGAAWPDWNDQRIQYPLISRPPRHGVPFPPQDPREVAELRELGQRIIQQRHLGKQFEAQQRQAREAQHRTEQMLVAQRRQAQQKRDQGLLTNMQQRRAQEEAKRRRALQDTQRRAQEEAERRRAREEAERRRAQEEAQRRAREEAQRRQRALELARIRRPLTTIVRPVIGPKPKGGPLPRVHHLSMTFGPTTVFPQGGSPYTLNTQRTYRWKSRW